MGIAHGWSMMARYVSATIVALLMAFAPGCAPEDAGAENEAGGADALSAPHDEEAIVALPSCVPGKMPDGASIRMMFGPKNVAVLQGAALEKEGLPSKGKLTLSRRTRGAIVQLGTMDADHGELLFEVPRGDLATSTFEIDLGASARGPLTAAAKRRLGEIYSVIVMKSGLLGDGIAARCETGGT